MALGQFCHTDCNLGFGDILGVERPAILLLEVCMFGMLGLGHDVEEVFKAGNAADVFVWSAIGTFDEAWIGGCGFGSCDRFNKDCVLPVVAKVVGVSQSLDASFNKGAQLGFAGVQGIAEVIIGTLVVWIRYGVTGLGAPCSCCKIKQVIVLKQRDGLDHLMQGQQADCQRNLDATPNHRFDVIKCDLETDNLIVGYLCALDGSILAEA